MKLVLTLVVALCASLTVVNGDDGDGGTPAPPTTAPPTTPKPTEQTTACKAPDAMTGGKAIPELPEEFQTTVEAKFLKSPRAGFKPFVLQVKEYANLEKRAVFQANGTTEKRMLFDLTNGYAFAFNVDDQCVGQSLKTYDDIDNKELYFQFSVGKDKKKTGTMMGLEDIYDFSTTHTPSQTSDGEMVRNINCDKWSTCLTWEKYDNHDFMIDFYWSKSDVKMPLNDGPVPVRVVVKGYAPGKSGDEDSLKYHHVYDFISFQDKVSDKSILWPELGKLCGDHTYYDLKNTDHDFPGIKDTFSVDLEQTNGQNVRLGKYVMDHVNNLMRTDLNIEKDDISFYKEKCGVGFCKVIHDFNVGLEFIIKENGMCSVNSIPVEGHPDAKLPRDIKIQRGNDPDDNKAYATMATGMYLFKVAKENVTAMEYQGKRKFREVEVDAWVARYSDNRKVYQEVLLREGGQLWGIIHNEEGGTGKWAKFRMNFYNYNENPDMSAFDIHYCFSDKSAMTESQKENFKSIHGRLTLKEKWADIEAMGMTEVTKKLRKQLVKSSGVNALRITDMMISKNGKKDDDVRFWFTVLWASPISGSVYHKGTPAAQKPTEDAVKDLEKDLKDDKEVTMDEDKKITIKGGSLKSDDDTMKDDPRPSQQNVVKTGHSGGQMATLGICMLILGAVIGIGVGFFFWKRRGRGVPYQIHH